jgi:hypothetical protein
MNFDVAGSRRPAEETTGDLRASFINHNISDTDRLEALLVRAPRGLSSGVSPEIEEQFIAEQEWLARYCLAHPRRPGYGSFVAEILGAALQRRMPGESDGPAWELLPYNNESCSGPDRRVTFGQVKLGDGPSVFVGSGMARSGERLAQFVFEISAHAHIVSVHHLESSSPEHANAVREELAKRHPAPWSVQVDRASPLGGWVDVLFADRDIAARLGQHSGELSLGVISEAVRDAISGEYSHFYLPRARRRGGQEPWQTGAFMRYEAQGFVWDGFALDRRGDAVLLGVRVDCAVSHFEMQERPPNGSGKP